MYLMFKMEVKKILEMMLIQFYNTNDNFDTKRDWLLSVQKMVNHVMTELRQNWLA